MHSTEKTSFLNPRDAASHIRRRVSDLAHFTVSPDARERLAEGSIHPVRALVLRAVLATPGLPQFLHEQVNVRAYREAGFDVLGVGFTAVAVNDGHNTVRKFYRHTSNADEQVQQIAIDKLSKKQALVLQHLGEYAVPQVFSIVENPLNRTESIVTATQQRVDAVGSLSIWKPEEIPESAHPFLADSLAMQESSNPSAVPDLLGADNALIERHTGAIKLIDPIAFLQEDPGDTKGYLRAANFLRTFHEAKSRRK